MVTAASTVAKISGPGSLASNPSYAITNVTLRHYLESQAAHVQDYLFLDKAPHFSWTAGCLVGLAVWAVAQRSRILAFGLAYVALTPLPIAFVGRSGGALYIPLFGWCLLVAELLATLARRASTLPLLRGNRAASKLAFGMGAILAFYLLFSKNMEHWVHEKPAMLRNGDITWRAIQDLNRLRPDIRPGARIAVADNPFADWDMLFIVSVWANVKPIEVVVVDKNVPPDGLVQGVTGLIRLDSSKHLTYEAFAQPKTIRLSKTK
jgi:hypothetical protein